MSGTDTPWTVGQALAQPELEQMAAQAARGGDDAVELLCTMGSTRKGVRPIVAESGSVTPTPLLVVPSVTVGDVSVRASSFLAFSDDVTVFLHGRLSAAEDVGPFDSTAGADRYDLVYAVLYREVTTSAVRKKKDATTGVVSSQTLDLATDPTVTLAVIKNVNSADPLLSLPADTPTAYNFGVAMVKLTDPYVSGDALTQAKIYQLWTGASVLQNRMQTQLLGANITSANKTSDWAKFSKGRPDTGLVSIFVPLKFLVPAADVVLDNAHDWRRRKIQVRGVLPAADGGLYKAPASVTVGGATSEFGPAQRFSGTNGAVGTPFYQVTVGGATFKFFAASATGVLTVDLSGAPNDAVNGDNWWFDIEATGQFDSGATPPY